MMSPHEKAELLRLIAKIPTETKCTDCLSFNSGSCNRCDMIIPEDVLLVGCNDWKFNDRTPPF